MCSIALPRRRLLQWLTAIATVSEAQQSSVRAEPEEGHVRLPSEMLGIRIPDTDVSLSAVALVRTASSAVLFNHCLRTFLLGMIDVNKRGLKVDEEAVFVASIMHDLALVPAYAGDLTKTFEENGAGFAASFVEVHGFSPDRIEKVTKSIRLHAGQAGGMGPNIEFVMVGAAQDLFGPTLEQLSDDELTATERAVPRLRFKNGFVTVLQDHVGRTKQPTWTAQFASSPPAIFLSNRWSE
jgi:hypothetical protein